MFCCVDRYPARGWQLSLHVSSGGRTTAPPTEVQYIRLPYVCLQGNKHEGWSHLLPPSYSRSASITVHIHIALFCDILWGRGQFHVHRCQHSSFRAGNRAFRALSRFSVKRPTFCVCVLIVQCIYRHVYLYFCVDCLFGIVSYVYPGADVARVKDIPGSVYLMYCNTSCALWRWKITDSALGISSRSGVLSRFLVCFSRFFFCWFWHLWFCGDVGSFGLISWFPWSKSVIMDTIWCKSVGCVRMAPVECGSD